MKKSTWGKYSKSPSQDFVKYGLIPEFVGRLPVSVALVALDNEALVRILTEPKSAIVKQYKKAVRAGRRGVEV